VGQRRGEKKKHLGQGGCSSAKRAERAHPQLVHWWLLIHSSPGSDSRESIFVNSDPPKIGQTTGAAERFNKKS